MVHVPQRKLAVFALERFHVTGDSLDNPEVVFFTDRSGLPVNFVKQLMSRFVKQRIVVFLFGVVGIGFVNAPMFVHVVWVYLVLFGLTGFPNVMSQVGQRSVAQRLCPPDVLGRLSGVMEALAAIGAGIGAGGVALLIDHVPVRVLFNVQTQCFTVCGLLGYWFVIRRLRAEPGEAGVQPGASICR